MDDRLTALERTVARQRAFLVGLGLLGCLAAFAPQGVPGEIRARSLVIVDELGREGVGLTAEGGYGAVAVVSGDRQTSAILFAGNKETGLTMRHGGETVTVHREPTQPLSATQAKPPAGAVGSTMHGCKLAAMDAEAFNLAAALMDYQEASFMAALRTYTLKHGCAPCEGREWNILGR